jgi:hypothetical protein
MTTNKKINLQYFYPVVIFLFISLAYFVPDVLEGKKIQQHDIVQFKGMSKEIVDHRAKYDEEPLWTNSMFGGMPAYLVSTQYKSNILRQVHRIFTLYNFRPVCFIFIYLTGAYLALLLFGLSPWISFAGAIAYGFSSYFFQIITAGHVSKVLALGYMPPIIAGVYASFRGKILIGSVITAIFLGLQILMSHLQITYYTLLIILILGITELITAIKNKAFSGFLKPLPWLFLFVILAIGANFSSLYTTYEYGKYSIRGPSELSTNQENRTSGLDKDYATQYSYSLGETFNMLIPNFMGGSSGGELNENSNTFKFLKGAYGNSVARDFVKSVPLYWGQQIQTAGPVYIGAVVVFLFILGLFILKGPVKWWLSAVTLFSMMLAWGHNFPLLTNFMLDYFPGYNKFRTVTMTLIMAEFAMPFMGLLAINQILTGNIPKKEFLKGLKYSLFGLGGLILIFMAIAGSFDMSTPYDQQRFQGLNELIDAVEKDRLAIFRSDAFRSLVFVILTAVLVYFAYLKKIKFNTVIILLAVLILADLWPVNKRYLNSSNFATKKEDLTPFNPSTADMIIMQDKDSNFKVLNVSLSPLQDASTSWFHKSIGGYHGAKIRRFQEMYDHHIQNEIISLYGVLQKNPVRIQSIDSVMATMNALNLLNTRYIIVNPEAPPLVNKSELGNAWFIDEIVMVENADEEINAIGNLNPSTQAVFDNRFAADINNIDPEPDSSDKILLTEYRANYLKYSSNTSSEQVAVFSEVYYDKGWQAYIDEKPVSHFRADYLLRAIRVPAGNHVIEFKFHPKSYFIGEKVSMASSLILILVAIGSFYIEWRKNSGKTD